MSTSSRRKSVKSAAEATVSVGNETDPPAVTGTRPAPRRSVRSAAEVKREVQEDEESDVTEEEEDVKPAKKKRATAKGTTAKAKRVKEDDDGEGTPKKKAKAKKAVEEQEYKPRVESEMCVGAHVSAAGGVENAVLNAAAIGANAFALFLKSQRKWSSPPLSSQSISLFKSRLQKYGYDPGMVLPHGSYLINLGNPDQEKREKSYECFLDDLQRCEQLGIKLYNFHPGSTVGGAPLEECLTYVAESINRAHKATSFVCVVIENMAGAGNVMGCRFSDLAAMIGLVEDKSRIGVCLDTCHLFASEFDQVVGLNYLKAWHLNDSKTPFNSKKDRHENLGLGYIGLPTFFHILTDPRLTHLPMVLETPSFEQQEVWGREIEVLYSFEKDNKAGTTVSWDSRKGQVQQIVKWAEEQGKKPGKSALKRKKGGEEDHECGSD
ncbi:AP endonuclease [Dacryopinax primogenitus]|uniref:Apurinic-apyrimidinic endonuclease 1 n=1 Tax=Dacryopinax primogenitus (strain DJM 731) TaxID=1858805 RepID=M5G933_DACPD|nr:AP endonuclease [Dacryopinax primogenitus]EJU05244.1 AP endonuclease [Dacryopinax primogenitus]